MKRVIRQSLFSAFSAFGILCCSVPFSAATDHPAHFAGQFYSQNSAELRAQILELLRVPEGVTSKYLPRVLLVPHAGYMFSGKIAGRAFAEIQDEHYPLVILMAVAHRVPLQGAATDLEGSFETPFGEVEIDTASARRLMDLSGRIKSQPEAFDQEHSVEVELPFLQVALSDFKILPILMSEPNLETAESVGKAVAALIREKTDQGIQTLLVISTDFAHYPSAADAQTSDMLMLDRITAVDPEGLLAASRSQMKQGISGLVTTMCGEAGVLAGLYAVRELGSLKPAILARATSADSAYGDAAKTVGYAAVSFYDPELKRHDETSAPAAGFELNPAQKKKLLELARSAAEQFVTFHRAPEPVQDPDPVFKIPKAVFVTLKKHGALRGCIGTLEARQPLAEAVQSYAVSAATQDHRFQPVTKEEFPSLTFEISVLTEPARVSGAELIRPGTDGVILKHGLHQGVFLPQVWEETEWGKEKFLNELAQQKAGLPPEAWKDSQAELYTFQVQSFSEGGD